MPARSLQQAVGNYRAQHSAAKVLYNYKDSKLQDHTKQGFKDHEVFTVRGVIIKNALTLLHTFWNMSSIQWPTFLLHFSYLDYENPKESKKHKLYCIIKISFKITRHSNNTFLAHTFTDKALNCSGIRHNEYANCRSEPLTLVY